MYRHDPEKIAKAYLPPDCSTFGNVGYVNKESFLFLTDRVSHPIFSDGVKCICRKPKPANYASGCGRCALFSIPCEEMGEGIKSVVQLEADVGEMSEQAQDLNNYCRERLSKVGAPKNVDFCDEFPGAPSGKLIRRKLRDEY
ncbi:AMP-binding enzyme [Paracoccus aerodenitrificans]|uniref:AMP-binding enzyme n=1 Tax=Paracoccus aerodenitrificans TaxID=3017781 RepID=UPI0022F0E789|nr:hypothetical protein [Paracoccus aerodenitrificans]WBU62742.1 hypothetical protein PAE61_10170 [Paracoccus aerodenitrificans]